MQNVVDVACSSPPVTMNATKPTAQTVQAADQDPFGLVLQKASERIVDNKQFDRSSKSSDSKSTENISGSDSTARKRIADSKNESEVNKSAKSEKIDQTDKAEKSEKIEKSEDDDKSVKKDNPTDPSILAIGYVNSEISTAINQEIVESASETSSEVIVAEAVQPADIAQMVSNTKAITEDSFSTTSVKADQTTSLNSADQVMGTTEVGSIAKEQTVSVSKNDVATTAAATNAAVTGEAATSEDPETKVETNPTGAFAEINKSADKKGENTKIGTDPTISNKTEEMGNGANSNANTNANSKGQAVSSNVEKYQEAASSTVVSVVKNEKPVADSTNPETAPPDTPDGTASVTVQTTSQISEPARLAEAPKNEVINQVANQVDQMVKTNRSSVRMQLYPEELGHIDLRIVTTKDGISVTMVTEKASTQQVLKSDMDILKQNIEQAGIQLSNLNINQGQNSNKQQSFEQRQNFSNSSYPGSSSENSNSSSNEPKKHLISSVVDYKV